MMATSNRMIPINPDNPMMSPGSRAPSWVVGVIPFVMADTKSEKAINPIPNQAFLFAGRTFLSSTVYLLSQCGFGKIPYKRQNTNTCLTFAPQQDHGLAVPVPLEAKGNNGTSGTR
ncbi:MAG: hypothetical protein GWN00_31155 [Aliifodinibius sp.]|nr:hypothetical protein [candidate division Zixibacteria bacterium]NIT60502.1 hypothetical protein [Fodinibius sp.]NIY29084.1 hypothetical protein [Fodinibius sp.]